MHLLHLHLHLLRPPRPLFSFSSASFSEGSVPPARDRVVDFGRHRGRRLGSLPSSYLRWVASALRARDSEPWARLADQVLHDPVYRDRLEWEHAARLLSGDALRASSFSPSGGGAVSELLDVAERFGWDYDDREGWARVDFELLGTSLGGRIPRIRRGLGGVKGGMILEAEAAAAEEAVVREKREERRERRRRRAKREKQMEMVRREAVAAAAAAAEEDGSSSKSKSVVGNGFVKGKERERALGNGDGNFLCNNPFPGRGALLDKNKKRPGRI